jgi:transcriptional regulator with XRE-family HTH domain
MTVITDEIFEARLITNAELAEFVKGLRQNNKWTQTTLAELSGLTERTIQRVENGEPSSLDTRRALAKAFEFKDLDFFENPLPLPNVEKLKADIAEMKKTTILIPIIKIDSGRVLRTMIEGTESYAVEEIGEHSQAARESFMAIVDCLSDYNDIRECFSMTQRLEVDRDIDAFLKTISDENAVVGAGLRHAKFRSTNDAPGLEPMDWTNIYFILCGKDALPSNIRVPKKVKLG